MHVDLLAGPRADPVWTGAWDSGLVDADPLSPFLARAWMSAWRAAYASDTSYRLMTATADGRLRAALPVVIERLPVSRFSINGLKYASSAVTGRAGPWLAPSDADGLKDILESFTEFAPAWIAFELADVVSCSRAHRALEAAVRATGMQLRAVPGRVSPYIECADSFAAWLAQRSRNLRSNRSRKLNRLSREGKVEFVECLGGAAVRAILPELFEVSRLSWKGRIGADMAASGASSRFYTELAAGGPRTHDLDAWLLKHDGRVIAIQVYWGNGYRKCLLRTDFRESDAALSPGDVLQMHVVERCHGLGVRELDLGGQDYGYKMRLTGRVREHVSFRIYRRTLAGRLIFLGSSMIGALRRIRKKQQPGTELDGDND